MEKILLAIGFRQLEEYIERRLKTEYVFAGTTVYREGIIRAIGQKNPDIVIIRETLEGTENILSIVYEIRNKFPKTRIIFLAGVREAGDQLLATLASYGVYDILAGKNIPADKIIKLVREPNEYKDVQHYMPAPVFDEATDKVLFTPPAPIIVKVVEESQKGESKHDTPTKPDDKTKKDDVEASLVEAKPVDTVKEDIPPSGQVTPPAQPQPVIPIAPEPIQPKPQNVPVGKITRQKIITFIGGKEGVGNSSIAFNMAMMLALRGFKTIYLEFDEKTPSVGYIYDIGSVDVGIDTALKALESENLGSVKEAIITSQSLKQVEGLLAKNYKKFPDSLDFMFFSKNYLTRDEGAELQEPLDMSLSKELYLHLMFQEGYDFVILDVPCDISHDITKNALIYSNNVYITVTQDVTTIGYALYKLNEFKKRKLNIANKIQFIVNKYEDGILDKKKILDWIKADNILVVPNDHKTFIDLNYLGLPLAIGKKSSLMRSAFQNIENSILS